MTKAEQEAAENAAKAEAKAAEAQVETEALEAGAKAAKEAAEEAEDLAKAQAKANEGAAEAAAKAAKDATEGEGDTVAGPAGATAANGADGAKANGSGEEAGVAGRASENSGASERAGPKEKGWNKVDDSLTATVRPEQAQEAEDVAEIAASRAAAERVQARMMQDSIISLIGRTDKVGITLKPIENASTERAGDSCAAASPKPDATEASQRVSMAA